jgi:alkylation response protein AidB-like acyl-CoA dehydrogenase
LIRYAKLAEGSLTAAFILSQHDAAIRRLVAGRSESRAEDWLDRIGSGDVLATVGISHLTTSRRLGQDALTATETPQGTYVLEGAMPWVSSASRADLVVAGATLPDGRQILAALPTASVSFDPPFALAALSASATAEARCHRLKIETHDVIAGPVTNLNEIPGLAGTGGLETSALAIGLSRAACVSLTEMAQEAPELAEPVSKLFAEWKACSHLLRKAADQGSASPTPLHIRERANALVLASTQAFLVSRKGTGFLTSSAAQRWARQALFFLVWSCPGAVAIGTINALTRCCEQS